MSPSPQHGAGNAGFSLIEICLALLVFIMSIFVIFALVPKTLEMSRISINDSHVALLASTVMPQLRANAETITNWNTWSGSSFEDEVKANIEPEWVTDDTTPDPFFFPTTNSISVNRSQMRAYLVIGSVSGKPELRTFTYYVDGSAYGNMDPTRFYSEVYFKGARP